MESQRKRCTGSSETALVMKQHTITGGEEMAEFGTNVETGLESLKHYRWYGMVAGHGHAVARGHRV